MPDLASVTLTLAAVGFISLRSRLLLDIDGWPNVAANIAVALLAAISAMLQPTAVFSFLLLIIATASLFFALFSIWFEGLLRGESYSDGSK